MIVVDTSVIYALLDQSLEIRWPHLKAALAVWRYCEQSARWLFGDQMADAVEVHESNIQDK